MQEFLQALRAILSPETVRDHGGHLYHTLKGYLLVSVQGMLSSVDDQTGLAGFVIQTLETESSSSSNGGSSKWEGGWPSKIEATKTLELDLSALTHTMKVENPQIIERPLDVVFKGSAMQGVIGSMLGAILKDLGAESKLGGKVIEDVEEYVKNHIFGATVPPSKFDPQFQFEMSGTRKLTQETFSKFRVSFYINVQVSEVAKPDQYSGRPTQAPTLREKIIWLAYNNPQLRKDLLPLLK